MEYHLGEKIVLKTEEWDQVVWSDHEQIYPFHL